MERESIHLPNSICTKCTEQAIIAYNFKVLCERSRVFFENYVAESVNDENSTKLVVVDSLNNNVQNIEHLCKEESKTIEVDGNGSDHLSSTAVKPKEELLFGAFPDVNDSTDNDFEEGEESCLYFCKSCNKSFKNKYILTSHQKRHQLKGQFLCNVCGKGFSSQSCLNRHNRVHTGKYEFYLQAVRLN